MKLSAPVKKRQIEKRGAGALEGRKSGLRKPQKIKPPHYPGWALPPTASWLPPDLQHCGVNITPTCIKALYDIPPAILHQPENVMGLYEDYDAFSQADISLFFENYAKNVPVNTAPKVRQLLGIFSSRTGIISPFLYHKIISV